MTEVIRRLEDVRKDTFEIANNCPSGKPIHGEDKCEAYNSGKCKLNEEYCGKYGGKKK